MSEKCQRSNIQSNLKTPILEERSLQKTGASFTNPSYVTNEQAITEPLPEYLRTSGPEENKKISKIVQHILCGFLGRHWATNVAKLN